MTIHELANFTGISIKTLHYYDKIDLLKPYCIAPNVYRQYNEDSLKRLQQIMFYKEMDPFSISSLIRSMICSSIGLRSL